MRHAIVLAVVVFIVSVAYNIAKWWILGGSV